MTNVVLECIMNRRTVRGYTDIPLSEEETSALVEAALISPSAMNRQPWHLSVVKDQKLLLELESVIGEYFLKHGPEALSERIIGRNGKIFYNAPTVFFISVKSEEGLIDVGIMAQSINIAAKSMGLSSVTLGLPRVAFLGEAGERWKTKLDFPEGYEYGISVAVGHGNVPPIEREPDLEKVTYVK